MKTHKELLTELIDAVYALPLAPKLAEVHDLQMKAAEIRGQMMATNPLQNETPLPQPDADEWIVNTGVMPDCKVAQVRFEDGEEYNPLSSNAYSLCWELKPAVSYCRVITHYKPA